MEQKERYIKLTTLQALILLKSFLEAPEKNMDADRSDADLMAKLNKQSIWLSVPELESFLYHAHMDSEAGKFWHPHGANFATFVRRLLPPKYKFDFEYNLIEEK